MDENALDTALNAVENDSYKLENYLNLKSALHESGTDTETIDELLDGMLTKIIPPASTWLDLFNEYKTRKTTDEVVTFMKQAVAKVPNLALWEAYGIYILEHEDEVANLYTELLRGARLLQYNIPQGHILWDMYFNSKEATNQLSSADWKKLYQERLAVPHATLDDTFSKYSTFVTEHFNDSYEQEMKLVNPIVSKARKDLSKRDKWEIMLSKAGHSLEAYAQYIDWELRENNKPHVIALYERALADHPNVPDIWADYILFLCVRGDDGMNHVVERAVRTCPWSGKLWGEYAKVVHSDQISAVIEEVFDVPSLQGEEWLSVAEGFFARRDGDLQKNSSLLGPLKDISDALVECLSSNGNHDIAVSLMQKFQASKKNQWRFWAKWLDLNKRFSGGDGKAVLGVYQQVLKNAMHMDWPDELLQDYITFSVGNCDMRTSSQVMLKVRQVMKKLNQARFEQGQQDQDFKPGKEGDESVEQSKCSLKRKSEHNQGAAETSNKRIKPPHPKEDVSSEPSRDREHTEVVVSGENLSESGLRDLFQDCGDIHQLKITENQSTATVEFKTRDAALSGLTKDHKILGGSEIRVKSGEATTLWVTNFPADYTPEHIRGLFEQYGKIIEVRFPSQRVKARRFCYVQFENDIQAHDALVKLNGNQVDNQSEHKLVVKVSNPEKRVTRTDSAEIFIKSIDFKVTEDQLRSVLQSHGQITKLRMPNKHKNKDKLHDGYAFVTMSSMEEAQAVVSSVNGTKLGERKLEVTPAHQRGDKNLPRQEAARTVTVWNVSETVNEEQLKSVFTKAASNGGISSVQFDRDRHRARVEFENERDVGRAALLLEGTVVGGQSLQFTQPPSTAKSTMFVPRNLNR